TLKMARSKDKFLGSILVEFE
ncbi:hypothetical protein ACNGBC_09490, partial [Campylobacter jejuni]